MKSESVDPVLRLYLEPNRPIEISELTNALGSLSRQYQAFAVQQGLATKQVDARLLVSNVAPGSIDINLIPDWHTVIATAVPLVPAIHDRAELVIKFAKRIKAVLDFFLEEKKPVGVPVTIKDCDDAKNIVTPIAQNGGQQTIYVTHNDNRQIIMQTTAEEARKIFDSASECKARLSSVTEDKKQCVALVWKQLARDVARTAEKSSPDRGIIYEIDKNPHPVFFTDDTAYLKREMIDDEENPYKKVFFVDVDISRVPGGGVGNYRITAFHGKEDFEPPSNGERLWSSA